jgi:hypothetical protein
MAAMGNSPSPYATGAQTGAHTLETGSLSQIASVFKTSEVCQPHVGRFDSPAAP